MLEIVENVEIDEAVVIACTEVGFKPRRAFKACGNCPHFRGIGRMRSEGDWSDQFAVRCGHIIERRTHVLEIVED